MNINQLDGIRGWAVILVVLSHCSNRGMLDFLPFNFSGAGKVGVWIFFTLSAFLLSKNLLENKYGKSPDSIIKAFLVSRFFRILIPYYFVILLGVLNFQFFKISGIHWIKPSDFFPHLQLTKAVGVFWSVVVEVKFYLLLPFVCFGLKHFTSFLGKIYFLVSSTLILSFMLNDYEGIKGEPLQLIIYLPFFVSGIIAYLLYKNYKKIAYLAYPALILTILIIPGILGSVLHQPAPNWSLFDNVLLNSIVACILISGVASLSADKLLNKFFSFNVFRNVGKYSFGIYLFHSPILGAVHKHFQPELSSIWLIAIIFIVSYFMAFMFFTCIEKPCHRAGLKLAGHYSSKEA